MQHPIAINAHRISLWATLENDKDLKSDWVTNIGILINDSLGGVDKEKREILAGDILDLLFKPNKAARISELVARELVLR